MEIDNIREANAVELDIEIFLNPLSISEYSSLDISFDKDASSNVLYAEI